jgi:hypothetical protein
VPSGTGSLCTLTASFTYSDTGGAGTDVITADTPGYGLLYVPIGIVIAPGTTGLDATVTWACGAGQTVSGTSCVTPPPAPQPQFPGFAFALGGQGGYTQPCDPGTCPTGHDAAVADNAPAPQDDFTPPNRSSSSDAASDDILSEALGTG